VPDHRLGRFGTPQAPLTLVAVSASRSVRNSFPSRITCDQASAAFRAQQPGQVQHKFPWDVDHGTTGDHVESWAVKRISVETPPTGDSTPVPATSTLDDMSVSAAPVPRFLVEVLSDLVDSPGR